MNPFDLPLWAKALILAALLAAGYAAVDHAITVHDRFQQEIGEQRVQGRWDRATEEDNARQRVIDDKRAQAAQEADHAHSEDLARVAADAARARSASNKLQRRVDDLELLATTGSCASAQAGTPGQRPGQQGVGAAGMLAYMQRRTDEAAGRIGQYADDLRAAGIQCERFDALNADPKD